MKAAKTFVVLMLVIVLPVSSTAVDECSVYECSGNPFPCCDDGNCTWWVYCQRPDVYPTCSRSAMYWMGDANGHIPTGSEPAEGGIAWFNEVSKPDYGHVAYITKVKTDGSFDVTEMNWCVSGMQTNDYNNEDPDGFIYGGAAGDGPDRTGTYESQTPTDPSGVLQLQPGEIKQCSFTFRDDGNVPWSGNGNSQYYVELHSVSSSWAADQSSDMACNWLQGSSTKIATTSGDVETAGSGLYSFSIKAHSTPGSYTLYVALYHPNSSSFVSGTGPRIEIEVIDPDPDPPFLIGSDFVPLVGYFNGDAKEDIAVWERSTGDLFVALSNGSTAFIPFSGPGTNGSMFDPGWEPSGTGPFKPFVADFSGDGYDDLALLDEDNGRWYVAYNWGSYFEQEDGTGTSNSWISSGWGESPYVSFVDDFSGDGYADICLFHPTYGRWFVAYNWDDHFAAAVGPSTGGSWLTNWKTGSSYVPFVADFSGDGYCDAALMLSTIGRWYVAYNDAVPTPPDFDPTSTYWITGGWGESPYVSFTGQFNIDDSADIAVFHPTYGRWSVAKRAGDTFIPVNGDDEGASWLDGWKTSASGTYEPLVGDFSGDGYTDICLYEPSEGRWYVAFNWAAHTPYPIFEVEDGPYANDSWLSGWAVETGGGGKIAANGDRRLPTQYRLDQNYPNPFNASTVICYSLDQPTDVTITVYNILGQRAATLFEGFLDAGFHQVTWDAGRQASGLYFYRIQTASATETKKMVLIK